MTNNTSRFTLRIRKELKEQLENDCDKMGVSLNSLISKILWDWSQKQDGKADTE